MSESDEDQLREFHLELELRVASMLQGVSITAIKRFYGTQTMDEVIAKILRPIVRHTRRGR